MRAAGGFTGLIVCFSCANDLGSEASAPGPNSRGQSNVTSSSSSGGSLSTSGTSCATADVRPIFQANCTQSICHDASQPAGGLDLSSADPAGQMLDVPSTLCGDRVRLVAGDPSQSLLWVKLTEQIPDCGDPMPIGGSLNADELGCIEQWIQSLGSGAPDCETCGDSACVDLSNDVAHCGACDVACEAGQVCSLGACAGCSKGQTVCGTTCVDTLSDPAHCGACDKACGAGELCIEGSCGCEENPSITLSGDIAPLLQSSCSSNACHGGRMPKQGLDLSSAASYESSVGVPADQCNDGRLLIEPGAPANSYLLQKLTGVDLCFGTLMPKADGALPSASVAAISSWICNGAPND